MLGYYVRIGRHRIRGYSRVCMGGCVNRDSEGRGHRVIGYRALGIGVVNNARYRVREVVSCG